MDTKQTRRAHHAGSWYSANGKTQRFSIDVSLCLIDIELDKQLTSWLEGSKFDLKNVGIVKAVVGP